jgi:hypothetical protein
MSVMSNIALTLDTYAADISAVRADWASLPREERRQCSPCAIITPEWDVGFCIVPKRALAELREEVRVFSVRTHEGAMRFANAV